MKKIPFALCALLLASAPAGATTYRAGLWQAKIDAATAWTTVAVPGDRTPGVVMAHVNASDVNYATVGYSNAWTGVTTYWNLQNTTFAYTGQMWMEGGTTYTFGKSLDDGAQIKIDGTQVMQNNTWNSFVTATYTPSWTGWHDVDIRVSDGTGGKGPCSNANGTWGTTYGLGWNTQGSTASTLSIWNWFVEDGLTNRFRVTDAPDCFSVDSTVKTSTGYEFTVTAADDVDVAVYRTSSDDYASAGSWTPVAGPVALAAGESATLSVATADESPVAYQIGACDFPASGDWYYQFVPCGAVGSIQVTGVGGKTIDLAATLSSFGTGAESATIRVEASTTTSFAEIVSASDEATVTALDVPQAFTLYGLSYDSAYYLRLRMVTATGTGYAPHGETVTTAPPLFPQTKVFAGGLVQAKITGAQENRTTAIADVPAADTAYALGTIMANTTGSATDLAGTSWSWAGNTVYAYGGKMWMEAGRTYTFGKQVDDWTYVVIDGTVLLDHNTWNSFQTCTYTPAASGWVPVEFRFGNGGGGAGKSDGVLWGFAYNTEGNETYADFKAGSTPWAAVVDPGDASLLCVEYSPTPFMVVDGLSPSGDDLSVTATFTGVPAGGATVQVLYGTGDGEYDVANWDSVATAGSVAAGDSTATYTVSGAGSAAFAAVRLVSADGVSPAWFQWSQIYSLAAESPSFGLVATDVQYTNATYAASCTGMGSGASSVSATLTIATDADFRNVFLTMPLNALVGVGGQMVSLNGFTTNTTYYARVTGQNSEGETGASSPVIVTTLDPQPPEGIAAFSGRGFTTLSATATVSAFGTGSSSAAIRFEASTDSFATLAGVSDEVAARIGTGQTLVVPDLAPATSHSLRLRIVNEWGLTVYVPISNPYSTREAPLAASGIGYTFASDGATVDFSFAVSEVFDGATCTAELEYDGRTFAAQTFTAAGTLSWPGVAAAAGAADATVTVTSVVDGTTYSQTWTLRVTPGSESRALSTLAELSGVVFRVGDTATLPELSGADDYYVVMDVRSFSLGADGVTLTALEPGFSAVLAAEWNAGTSSYAIGATRALAVCIPEVEGSGRVFLARPGSGKMNWEDTAKWTNLTDPTAAADYPHLAGDIAMAALPGDQLILNADATVAELYVGPNEQKLHQTVRLTGKNSATLTFRRPSGKPGLLRFTGLGRTDTPLLTGGWSELHVGGGDGNSTTTGLGIEMPGGLVFDGGAWPDYTALGTPEVDSFGHARYIMGDNLRFWNVPEGKTFRIVNTYGRYKMTGDDQEGNANFSWGSGGQVTGAGTWFYDGVSSTFTQGIFRTFEGVVKVSNKQAYDAFAAGSRGGSFKFRPENTSSSAAAVAENATLLVEGDVGYSGNGLSHSKSIGVVFTGSEHGYGSWDRAINAFPAKKWILDGGYLRLVYVANGSDNWREDGTKNTAPICIPNGAETLVVSNGFTEISMSQSNDDSTPTNSLAFARLEHAGDGVLLVSTARTYDSYQNNGAGSSWRVRAVLGGFHGHAIGGTGHAASRHGDASVRANVLESTAPIVPWIVSDIQYGYNIYFPGADDETDEIVLAGYAPDLDLDAVSDPTANAKGYNKSVALTADKTVNSFVLQSNTGSGRENLGAGRTLTITSGGLILSNNNLAKLGNEAGGTSGEAGTVVFPNKAYVYSTRQSESQPNEIWAKMVSPHGAVFSYPGDLRIGGDQTGIDDHIAVNGMRLQLGSSSNGCEIDVPVHLHGTAKLSVNKEGSFCKQDLWFWDHGTTGSKFVPAAGTQERVHKAYVDGVSVKRGVWGSSESSAPNVDDAHFAGSGTVKILADDLLQPTILMVM